MISCVVCSKRFANNFTYSAHFDRFHHNRRDFAIMIIRGLWLRLTGGFN